MSSRPALLSRVRTAIQEVNASQRALEDLEVGERLAARVRGRLDLRLNATRDGLLRIEADARDAAAEELRPLWGELSDAVDRARPVHREVLAFLDGILLRSTPLDGGVCDAADALLDDVGRRAGVRWERFTLLADDHVFGELAGLVRLRFPPSGVWDLPLAVHEFGHAAAPRIEVDGRPVLEDLLVSGQLPIDAASYEAYVHEYFADCFATWTIGPAYPAACLLLRFPSERADEDRDLHPAPARRAHVMLAMLERLDGDSAITRPFRDHATALERWWSAIVADAGGAELAEGEREDLDAIVARLAIALEKGLEPDARFDAIRFGRASALAMGLRDPGPPDDAPEATLTDVVNAAWLARVERWEQADEATVHQLGRHAMALCAALAERATATQQGALQGG